MESELNDLSTNNTNVTFSNNTNNTETSDELKALPVYTLNDETNYAKRKRISRIIVATGISLITAGSIVGISNVFITNPPEVSNLSITISNESDSLHYYFIVNNESNYNVIFTLSVPEQDKRTIDVSATGIYEGDETNLGYEKNISYKIVFSNRLDYKKTLISGSVTTISI